MTETFIRLGLFLSTLAVLLILEHRYRRHAALRWKSVLANLALVALSSLLLRLLFFVSALAASLWAAAQGFGLLNLVVWPTLIEFVMAFLLLDCAVYCQHRLMHRVPLLWQLHKVHHSDLDVDVSTGVRFHPFEIVISQLWKIMVVVALGLPLLAVVVFELALSLFSLFVHAKLPLSERMQFSLSRLIVTPSMHQVHHNREQPDTDRNFSTVLSCWDKLFGSYRSPNESEQITFGLREYPASLSLAQLLVLPFRPNKHSEDDL